MPNLFEAQKHSTNNRSTIEASSICGCYYCQTIFSPHEIVAWTGLDLSKFNEPNAHANTALCPHCGSESVIGNKSGYTIDIGFLSEMNDAWFEKTIVHKRTPRNLNP